MPYTTLLLQRKLCESSKTFSSFFVFVVTQVAAAAAAGCIIAKTQKENLKKNVNLDLITDKDNLYVLLLNILRNKPLN